MHRLDSRLLAGAGVLIVHQVAYTISAMFGIETSVAHGHFAVVWFAGSLALLAALVRTLVISLKRRQHDAGNVNALAATIGGGYLALEWVERFVDGYDAFALFAEPVLWLGLALAPLVALALHYSVRSVAELAFEYLTVASRGWVTRTSSVPIPVRVARPTPSQLSSVVSRRGPPIR